MGNGYSKTLISHGHGQSMVEFALILPLFVLFIVGIFELGRAFFAFISISNAAREGARVVTFWPGKTTLPVVTSAITTEVATNPGFFPVVDWHNIILPVEIQCGASYTPVTTDAGLQACPSDNPVRVTVTYKFNLILNFFSPGPILLKRSAEMMIP